MKNNRAPGVLVILIIALNMKNYMNYSFTDYLS